MIAKFIHLKQFSTRVCALPACMSVPRIYAVPEKDPLELDLTADVNHHRELGTEPFARAASVLNL